MDYTQFTVSQFADDASFRNWVNRSDARAVAFWEDWIARHPERQADVMQAVQLVQWLDAYQPPTLPETDVQREVDRFRRAIAPQEKTVFPPRTPTAAPQQNARRLWPVGAWRQMAAAVTAILLLVGSAYLINQYLLHPTLTIHTPLGGLREVTLPDGSRVTLNANTTLRYGKDWSDAATREVWLEGEAFFKVVKQRAAGEPVKFVVHTDNVQVQVLGTQFNVTNRRGATEVVLTEGKVQLVSPQLDAAKPLLMQPGEYGALSEKDKAFRTKKVIPAQYSAWTQNKLVFEATPLWQIARMLEDNYGWQVTFEAPALADEKFTATIPTRDPDVLLSALAESFKLRVRKSGNQVVIATQP